MTEQMQPKPPERQYTDLLVELRDLDPVADRYTVDLSGPGVGELAPVAVSLRHEEFAEVLQDVEDWGLDDPSDVILLGRALADRLFPEGPVRTAVTNAIRSVGTDEGVRIRLLIRDPLLAQLPWEYTYLSSLNRDRMADFLVLDPKVSLVRHEALPLPRRAVTPRDANYVRVLVVTANVPGMPPLDLKRDRKVVEQGIKAVPGDGTRVSIQSVLQDPSVDQLRSEALRGADVFHFAGHGGFDASGGHVMLPSCEGSEIDLLAAEQLAQLLRQAGTRLAVLGACESGRRDGRSPWEGVAAALLSAEVAAVIAMQYPILDTSAIKFARGLYSALAAGMSIDEAVTTGRLSMYDPDDYRVQWGVPVLYSRSPDGVLFPNPSDGTSASADDLRISIHQVVENVRRGGSLTGLKIGEATVDRGFRINVIQEIGETEADVQGVVIDKLHRPNK